MTDNSYLLVVQYRRCSEVNVKPLKAITLSTTFPCLATIASLEASVSSTN